MHILIRSLLFKTASMVLPLLLVSQANAQEPYPNRSIKIIVPFTAGGVVDSTARIIGEKLSRKYGQPVVVENKTGASGAIGTESVSKAAPDGYTLLCVSPGHAILPSLLKNIHWNPVKDFRAVEGLGEIANVIAVRPDLPVKNMKEFVALAKKSSAAPLSFASPGVGTSIHLAGALFAQQADIVLTHVPYRGQPDAISDLIAGRVDMMPLSTSLAIPYLKSGKLRGLAVTTSRRSSLLPDIPTLAEAAGLPNYQASTWFGFVAPAGTPDAIIDTLSSDIALILEMPDVKAKFATLGMDLTPQSPKQFDDFVAVEYAKWQGVIKKGGLEIQ